MDVDSIPSHSLVVSQTVLKSQRHRLTSAVNVNEYDRYIQLERCKLEEGIT